MRFPEIKNIDDAKVYFIAMGCSSFHIAREDFSRRDEYYSLKISKETESIWRNENIDIRFLDLINTKDDSLGTQIYLMKDLISYDGYRLNNFYEYLSENMCSLIERNLTMILDCIIGNNGSQSRGGLIEIAIKFGENDLAIKFTKLSLALIQIAKEKNIKIPFIRGYLCDVIRFFNFDISGESIIQLIEENDKENFDYYMQGANENNIYSVRRLSEFFYKGIGCTQNVDKAKKLLIDYKLVAQDVNEKQLKEYIDKIK